MAQSQRKLKKVFCCLSSFISNILTSVKHLFIVLGQIKVYIYFFSCWIKLFFFTAAYAAKFLPICCIFSFKCQSTRQNDMQKCLHRNSYPSLFNHLCLLLYVVFFCLPNWEKAVLINDKFQLHVWNQSELCLILRLLLYAELLCLLYSGFCLIKKVKSHRIGFSFF